MKKIDLKNDIMIIEDFMSEDDCDAIVDMYSNQIEETGTRRSEFGRKPLDVDDTAIYMPTREYFSELPEEIHKFNYELWTTAWKEVEKAYPILSSNPKMEYNNFGLTLQKTEPGEGYHVWHHENSSPVNYSRIFAFILYLNDDFEAGETEFLSQSRRITPKKGTLAIWPAYYTHAHRGNPPIGGTKYILTSWIHMI